MMRFRFWLAGSFGTFLLLLVVLLASGEADAGGATPKPSIIGKVMDQEGVPVSQQPVVIEGPEGVVTSVTNSEGRFLFYNLQSGDYKVKTPGAEAGKVVFVESQPWYERIWKGAPASDPAVVDLKVDAFEEKPGPHLAPGTHTPIGPSPE